MYKYPKVPQPFPSKTLSVSLFLIKILEWAKTSEYTFTLNSSLGTPLTTDPLTSVSFLVLEPFRVSPHLPLLGRSSPHFFLSDSETSLLSLRPPPPCRRVVPSDSTTVSQVNRHPLP